MVFQVTWAGGPPSPYLTLKSWGWEDGQGTSGPALAWSLGACHAEGAGTLGRLRGCLKRRESTGASSLKRRESTRALIQPALASSLVTRGPCGCSLAMPGEALIGSGRALERPGEGDSPGRGTGGVLLPSSFQQSWVLLILVLISPIFPSEEKK